VYQLSTRRLFHYHPRPHHHHLPRRHGHIVTMMSRRRTKRTNLLTTKMNYNNLLLPLPLLLQLVVPSGRRQRGSQNHGRVKSRTRISTKSPMASKPMLRMSVHPQLPINRLRRKEQHPVGLLLLNAPEPRLLPRQQRPWWWMKER